MKRIKIVGLCLVAAFAFSAMAASSASAGEYGQCVEQKHGYYTESNCKTVAVKVKKGVETPDYKGTDEWVPGPSPTCVEQKHGYYTESKCETVAVKVKKGVETPDYKGDFEKACPNNCAASATTTGPGTLKSGAPLNGEITCSASHGTGLITGPKSDVDQTIFTGCETLGQKCENTANLGEIETFPLETTLIDHGEVGLSDGNPAGSGLGPAVGEVWTQFANVAGYEHPYSAIFACENVGYFRTKGSLSGVTTGNINVMEVDSTTNFATGEGEQDLITEYAEHGLPGEWTGELYGPFGEAASEEILKGTAVSEEKNEIKT